MRSRAAATRQSMSYKGIEPHVTPFTRIVELWYRDSNAWIRNWVDGKPNIKAPSWKADGQNAMYLTPYRVKQGTAYYTDN